MSDSPFVLDVGDADFAEKVMEQSKQRPVVVDFWAAWCGPCRMLGPILEKVTKEKNGEVILAKVDIDENQGLARQFQVQSIPLVLAFRNGEVVLGFRGLIPEPQVREFYNRLFPTETELQLQQAAKLEATQPAEAEKLYRGVQGKEPDNAGAVVGLARLLIQAGKDQDAAALLEKVIGGEHGPEAEKLKNLLTLRTQAKELGDEATLAAKVKVEPENAEARYQLGLVLAGAGRYPEALEMLLAAAQRDRDLGNAKVQPAMVQIFRVVGIRSELADTYRDRLTKLLY